MGKARDTYLAFAARQDTAVGAGALVLYWPNAPNGSAGCSSNISWPILDAVTILGIPPVDTASVSVLVCFPHPAARSDRFVDLPESTSQRLESAQDSQYMV